MNSDAMTLDAFFLRENAPSMIEFAREGGWNPDQIRQWRHRYGGRRPSPPECAKLERQTSGLVPCELANDSVRWTRVPDSTWPWHPMGRPVVEVAPQATTKRARRKAEAPVAAQERRDGPTRLPSEPAIWPLGSERRVGERRKDRER